MVPVGCGQLCKDRAVGRGQHAPLPVVFSAKGHPHRLREVRVEVGVVATQFGEELLGERVWKLRLGGRKLS